MAKRLMRWSCDFRVDSSKPTSRFVYSEGAPLIDLELNGTETCPIFESLWDITYKEPQIRKSMALYLMIIVEIFIAWNGTRNPDTYQSWSLCKTGGTAPGTVTIGVPCLYPPRVGTTAEGNRRSNGTNTGITDCCRLNPLLDYISTWTIYPQIIPSRTGDFIPGIGGIVIGTHASDR